MKKYYEMSIYDAGGYTDILFSSLEKAEEWIRKYSRMAKEIEKIENADSVEYKFRYDEPINNWSAEIYEKQFADLT